MRILIPTNLDDLPEECWGLNDIDDKFTLRLDVYGIGTKIKITLISSRQKADSDIQTQSLFKQMIQKIVVFGLPCTQMVQASNIIPMLNITRYFEKNCFQAQYSEESQDAMFLTSLALISGRKFVQAIEILKKIQERLLKNFDEQNEVTQHKILTKCSKIEILIADCFSQHS